jgi:ubiquinone/menaquinone biosynthesis C-methylase UbiE
MLNINEMTQDNCNCLEDSVEKCDIFDFMAKYVGLSVLHPGGFKSTEKLITNLNINGNSRVLDIACGKGTTSILIAKKYQCHVIGIDISPELIQNAQKLAKRNGVDNLVKFEVGDATNLPFQEDEFDITIAQAMLVLIENRDKVVQEAMRVLKPAGRAGWIELTWQVQPTGEFMKQVSEVICAYCMLNVRLASGWEELFIGSGVKELETEIFPMHFSGFTGMIKDEGLQNSIRVIIKYMTIPKIRKRMVTMNRFFKKYEDIFGYGIYTMVKERYI